MAIKLNDSNAYNNLGVIYEKGIYVPRDIAKAIYYFSVAADLNDINSLYNLGNLYYQGRYIKQDINKAIFYFPSAAEKNDSDAQFIMKAKIFNVILKKQFII